MGFDARGTAVSRTVEYGRGGSGIGCRGASDQIQRVLLEEEQQLSQNANMEICHLSTVSLVIGTVYYAKGHCEFGIGCASA